MHTILGIDPGSRHTGFGIIQVHGSQQRCITCGQINTKGDDLSQRLLQIYQGISEVIQTYQPNQVAIEQVFMHRNANSALKLGQARGAALIAPAVASLPISEYSPREIKQAVVGYGNASKEQIQHMITLILGLNSRPESDAADALAVAVCHNHNHSMRQKIQRAEAKEHARS